MSRALRNQAIRRTIASISGDVSTDAVGSRAPKLEEIFAPEAHAAALDPKSSIVVGARGAGKSFWSGVLGSAATKEAAAVAYPRLHLEDVAVEFAYTGVPGARGLSRDAIDSISADQSQESARNFWWAAILRAAHLHVDGASPKFKTLLESALDWETRGEFLSDLDGKLERSGKKLLVIFDALDTISASWSGRRILTESLLEVVWAMRGYPNICPKLFLRPDQIDDQSLRFVELPKLRSGAVRLTWTGLDLYGLFFARLGLGSTDAASEVVSLLREARLPPPTREAVLSREWAPTWNEEAQRRLMDRIAGPYMASGTYGYKKGRTYDWPLSHLADAHDEVTPRSFLGLVVAAATFASQDDTLIVTPEGIRHGLRAASQTRVDQLHQEFPWIKGVLAPLDGLLLPQEANAVFKVWRAAKTVQQLKQDAENSGYLSPIEPTSTNTEERLLQTMEEIGVMFRRHDNRIDMPDLYRVAARLLKKGGTAPL